MTNNPGILPIKLGQAKLQSSTHTFIHYFDTSKLLDEYYKLKGRVDSMKSITDNSSIYQQELDNYYKILDYDINLINEKLIPFPNPSRVKRGLINGLGSILKQITGNMDIEDSERIALAINNIKQNQNNLALQLNNQYSINNELITKFNNTVKDIEHNEKLLFTKTAQLEEMIYSTQSHLEVLFATDILNQLVHLFNIILNIFQDIENSMTFCKSGIIHPSIITSEELIKELNKISLHYQNKLPFAVSYKNIQNYKKILKPSCSMNNYQVLYSLTLPLFDSKTYEFYYFLPIPNMQFQTIIPVTKYILKSESGLVPLMSICDEFDDLYLCDKNLKTYENISCEEAILTTNTFAKCSLTQLKEEQSIEYIPELNQYLALLPKPANVKYNCKNIWTRNQLKGTFLFESNNQCQQYVDNHVLQFNDVTKGQPLLLHVDPLLQHNSVKSAKSLPQMQLRHLRVTKLSSNVQQLEVDSKANVNPWHLSGTVTLYIIAAILACLFIVKRYFKKKPTTHPHLQLPLTTINADDVKI